MRFRGKNSLPLTPKTVHLLRLPRTIGKRKGDDNKFFPLIFRANHKCLATTLPGHFQESLVNGLCSFRFFAPRLNEDRLIPGFGVAWIENNSPSQYQPGNSSCPVPNC